ncbi:flagellar hook-associated protein FlgK [Metabacillus fastidiosus]|uniref:flagellar hook-associated protein FlgK n=1 Tax=Metabacillus fastidiosus TaxID=1458 RepID=UPI002DB7B835|nr:flagellar hook-associated protein FlgK [Metabacillus fastidiosus]MEC2077884.1 flagellar hook-associated protein FlgK [Metabacillus fastidiosus]
MRSTFMGLEISKRGMFTQQGALHTTGNNISNVNTPGYSRQRINFEATSPYPSIGMSRPQLPGQMGTGVEAGSVQRIREGFLDLQYRQENNKLGYWASRADALQKMEEVMNEPSDAGLSKTLDRFWQSLQDLAVNPTNAGARSVVRERGVAVAETFNYLSTSLKQVQGDLKSELKVSVDEINSIANQLNNINKQISEIEPHGYLPNELYDERDRLLDKLSTLANIKVTSHPSGGNALKIAEGTVTVEIVDKDGQPIKDPADPTKSIGPLVGGTSPVGTNKFEIQFSDTGTATSTDGRLVHTISLGGKEIKIDDFSKTGKISSLIETNGYFNGTDEKGLYPEMLKELDTMAFEFIKQFNAVHSAGKNIIKGTNGNSELGTGGINFFSINNNGTEFFPDLNATNSKNAASLIQISTDIKASSDNIAAADPSSDAVGNGDNAIKLAEVKNKSFTLDSKQTTFQNFYEGLIGGMAVNAQEAERFTDNTIILRDSVDQRRQSVSAVSLDEEMTNMIQFQHAYNASARMITMQDELLDKIINGMGMTR